MSVVIQLLAVGIESVVIETVAVPQLSVADTEGGLGTVCVAKLIVMSIGV